MSNPSGKLIICACLIFLMTMMAIPSRANPYQYFPVKQSVRAYANHRWTFLTAWNLTSGKLQRSQNWYNGTYEWYWNEPNYLEWNAIFIYDYGTMSTVELKWLWTQHYYQY